jgi:hypothetical protein
VRYDDLTAEPEATLARILAFIDEASAAPTVRDSVATLPPNHTVSGNPCRFSTGEIKIDLDDEWRRAMGTLSWCAATAIALPSIRRYGYGIGAGAPWARGHVGRGHTRPRL